jgi:DNA-binding transcriptional LysR family regulator
MLDVRRMKVLKEVAAQGSFSAAADALSFTQSAVSQQIAALEREAGTTLLERSSKGVRLTDAGRALVAHADVILARLDDAEEELAELAGLRGGRLRLATFQSGGATLVPRAVKDFHDRYPAVELSMVEAEPPEAQERLLSGDIDIAVVYDFEPLPGTLDQSFELTPLIEDPYDLVVARDHPLAKKRAVRIADLRDESWVCASARCGCQQIVEHAARTAGFDVNMAFEVDETMAAQALVAAGVGIMLYPRLALTPLHPGVVSKPLAADAPVRRVWAERLGNGYRSPASDAMLQIMVDVADEFGSAPAPSLEAVS